MNRERRLAFANSVICAMGFPYIRLYEGERGLRVMCDGSKREHFKTTYSYPADVSRHSDFLRYGYHRWPFGSNSNVTIGYLARWVRGEIAKCSPTWWDWTCSPNCNLLDQETAAAVKAVMFSEAR